jgi:uncharacterized RDD family membrane protein YckC
MIVDWVIVGAPLLLFGWLAFDAVAQLGSAGRLIGLAAGMLYFGLLESRFGGGQTLGKRLLKLEVRSVDGGHLSPTRAAIRALIKIAPFVVNQIDLPEDGTLFPPIVLVFAGTLIFGLGLAQLYLYIFDRPARRLVHDLSAGSVVVRAGWPVEVLAGKAIHQQVAVAIVAVVAVLLAGAMAYYRVRPLKALQALSPTMATAQRFPDVLNAGVTDNTTTFWDANGGKTRTRTLIVTARLRHWPSDPAGVDRRLALAVLNAGQLQRDQKLEVSLTYGFELGFASGWRSYVETHWPADWRAGATSGRKPPS